MKSEVIERESEQDFGGALRSLRFVRSGDYIGIERRGNLSRESLNPAEFAKLDRLVDSVLPRRRKSDWLAGAERHVGAERRARHFQYSLVVVRDRGTESVVLSDDDTDERAMQLLRFLDERSTPAL